MYDSDSELEEPFDTDLSRFSVLPVPSGSYAGQVAVHDGRLQPGDPFENEVALAARLSLSRPTVRRAMQERCFGSGSWISRW